MAPKRTAIIATIAALISATMALLSWWYNRETSKATISFQAALINPRRMPTKDTVQFDISFEFKNLGRESAKILDLKQGLISFNSKTFEQLGKKPMLNIIHSNDAFYYNTSFKINVDMKIPDEELNKKLPDLVGMNAIIIILKYRGISVFSRRAVTSKLYFGFKGTKEIFLLDEDDYKLIEDKLPEEFKANK